MKNLTSILVICTIAACSPKTNTSSQPATNTEAPVQEEESQSLTSCTTLSELSPSDKDQAETAFVLYRDAVKANKFDDALPLWKTAYYLAPGANGRIQYHFDDGVKIYTDLYKRSNDNVSKQAYMDTVMMIYDKRVECFGDVATIKGRKAFDLYYNFYELADQDEIYTLFTEAVMAKGEKADYFVINPFSKILHDRVVEGKTSKEEGLTLAKTLSKAIAYGQANCGNKCSAWEIIASYAPNRLESLEGVDGFYDCEYYTDTYYGQFVSQPDNCEIVELAYRRMLRGGCDPNDPKLIEVKAAKDNNCYTPPPPPGPLKQAYDAYTSGDYRRAVELFDSFVQKTDDIEKKAKYTLLIAKIYYGDIKNYAQARNYALAAVKYKDNWGEPYILIGKLYASSGPLCGPGRGWDSQVVTWPAIDKFQYAKKIDPSVAAEANKWINTYSKYMPNREDIFLRGIKEGSSYTVGCWINEKTTVRIVQ